MKTYITTARMGITSIGLAAALAGTTALADQVILDDLIVDGSACIGFDCVNGESFGFDTLRLKENNIRIKAMDTSSSASFPSRDWQITFNDSANGGLNKFSIDDIDGGRTPFTLVAGAPSHSLYVNNTGNVGFGTSAPVVELHIKDGDSPTMRLEQDGSSGFTPQTWDIAGNESNFFIRDVTNGSKLPFRIRPSAPSSSIDIAADGDIGLGTASPDARLHVINGSGNALLVDSADAGAGDVFVHFRASDGTAALRIEETSAIQTGRQLLSLVNKGNPQILLDNTGVNQQWEIGAGLNLVIKNLTSGTTPIFTLAPTGNLTLTGSLTTTGSCSVGCDRVFGPDYTLLSIEEHAQEMFANSYLPNVGPTSESGEYELTSKVLGMLNELEQAHIYISQLNDKITALEQNAVTVE